MLRCRLMITQSILVNNTNRNRNKNSLIMKTKNYYKSQVKFINLRDNNKNLFKSCMYINFTLSKFLDIIGALKFSYFSYKKKSKS